MDGNFWHLQGLCLYLVGSSDKPPKEAPYLGRLGWMDVDNLLESANLVAVDDSGTSLPGRDPVNDETPSLVCAAAIMNKHVRGGGSPGRGSGISNMCQNVSRVSGGVRALLWMKS